MFPKGSAAKTAAEMGESALRSAASTISQGVARMARLGTKKSPPLLRWLSLQPRRRELLSDAARSVPFIIKGIPKATVTLQYDPQKPKVIVLEFAGIEAKPFEIFCLPESQIPDAVRVLEFTRKDQFPRPPDPKMAATDRMVSIARVESLSSEEHERINTTSHPVSMPLRKVPQTEQRYSMTFHNVGDLRYFCNPNCVWFLGLRD